MICFLLSGGASFAQLANKSDGTTHEERAEEQALQLSNELNLSEAQKQQVYLLLLDRSIKMMANRDARNEEGVLKAEKDYQIKFLDVLNVDQITKHKEIEDEKRQNPAH